MSMGLLGEGRFSAVQPFDHRRRDRRGCDIGAAIIISHGELRARIFNISAGGIGFTIDPMLGLKPGERILMRQEMLGEVRCVIRWSIHPRYGAAFDPDDRTPPGARNLYDSLGQETDQSG
jgi:hypothetical protein